jgi:hypothetical protein
MKDGGIGTPATRASIIETLLRREYIERKGKNLVPTPQGQALVLTLPVEVLKSPKLTGSWEEKLTRVSLGQYPRASFMAEVRDFTAQTVKDILGSSGQPSRPVAAGPPSSGGGAAQTAGPSAYAAPAGGASGASLGPCPVCGKPVHEGAKAYSCESGRSCSFVIFKTIAGKNVRDRLAAFLLTGQRTQTFQGFKSKAGKTFAAALQLNAQGQVELHFDNAPASPSASASPRTLVAAPAAPPVAPPAAQTDGLSEDEAPPTKAKKRAKPKAAPVEPAEAPTSPAEPPASPKPKATKKKTKPAEPAEEALSQLQSSQSAAALTQSPEPLTQSPEPLTQAPNALTQAPEASHAGIEGRTCPLCDQGALVKGRRGWGCSRWREGCKFVLWFDQDGLTLDDAHAHALLDGLSVEVRGPQGAATLRLSLYAPTFIVKQP